MKMRLQLSLAALAATLAWTASTRAALVVNDTWRDGNRNEPTTGAAAGPHSENGIDGDADGDLESVWYSNPGAAMTSPVGHLIMDNTNGGANTGSSSYQTYFAPDASPVTLGSAGEKIRLTWVFTPSGVTASGTGQQFNFALVNSPTANRVIADGATPGTGAYDGYAIYGNMRSGTLGNSNSFQLRERTGVGNFLSTSGEWTALANGANASTPGYTSGTQYTLVWTMTRTALGELDINVTMSGAGLGGAGNQISVSFLDASPETFSYDMFGLRPSAATGTATSFDTTLFRVEHIPEPASAALAGLGGLAMLAFRRRR